MKMYRIDDVVNEKAVFGIAYYGAAVYSSRILLYENGGRNFMLSIKEKKIIMKKMILFCSLFVLLLAIVSFIRAEAFEIPLDDTYVEGVITPLETEKISAEENEIQVYSFQLEEPGKIALHFISHVNSMRFQIKDIDENVIEDDYIRSEYSPKDYELILNTGTYTLHIIKIAPTGLMGVQVSEDNVGSYKFKMKYSPILSDKQKNDIDAQSSYGEIYEDFFQSRNNSNAVEKSLKLKLEKNGTYVFQMSSDMTLNYLIKDVDENIIGRGTSYPGVNSRQEFALTSGSYNIVCSTSEAGSYQINIEPKEIEASDKKDAVQQEDTGKDSERGGEKNGIIEKICNIFMNDTFSSTIGGTILLGIIVAVVGGGILYLLTKK